MEWIQNYRRALCWSNLFFRLISIWIIIQSKVKKITIPLNVYLKLIFWHRCQDESADLTPVDIVDYITKKIINKSSKVFFWPFIWVKILIFDLYLALNVILLISESNFSKIKKWDSLTWQSPKNPVVGSKHNFYIFAIKSNRLKTFFPVSL
jgi:hypothetical protein